VTRTERLNELFCEWKASKSDYAGKFSPDGVVDEECYEKAARRVLFVLKEPNAHHDDLRDHARNFAQGKNKTRATWRNLAYWSYGILREFPVFSQVKGDPAYPQVLHEIAVMNLKKTPGGGSANDKEINRFALDRSNQVFIRREIEIIAPQIIISCVGTGTRVDKLHGTVRSLLAPGAPWLRSQNGVFYLLFEAGILVAFAHPAGRFAEADMYKHLVGETQAIVQ
jgi:hypothetical protein